MDKRIKGNVLWIGKVDWELRSFHGRELSTHRGTTYNSYLIREEKTVLIDTVWKPFDDAFVANLTQTVDLKKIDAIVVLHGEPDHSGSLPALMQKIPGTPVYCTANAVDSLKGQYHKEWNFHTVKTGDRLPLGNGKELVFIEMAFIHWPDSMAAFLTGDNILFSNDAFGQHLAGEELWADLADQCELYEEALKYYANIITPFDAIVKAKLAEIAAFDLPFEMIAPSHGLIWRQDPKMIISKYGAWAADYQENQITILYDTMWQGTEALAHAISEGVGNADPAVRRKVYNTSRTDKNDMITEIFKSKTIAVGSPTVNNGVLYSIAGLLAMIRKMRFKNKKAAVFGCYGWGGGAQAILKQALVESGFAVMDDGLRYKWYPDEVGLKAAYEYGKKLAAF
jgi:Uncharacterized flavoproteins